MFLKVANQVSRHARQTRLFRNGTDKGTASRDNELRSQLPVKVHKIQRQRNECKLFRSLDTVPVSLPLSTFPSSIPCVPLCPHTRVHTLGKFASRLRERENIPTGNKLQLEPFYLRGRFGENVNTRRAIHFRSGWIYFDSVLTDALFRIQRRDSSDLCAWNLQD